MAPAIVTARQPYLLTNDDEIGPIHRAEQFVESNEMRLYCFDQISYQNTMSSPTSTIVSRTCSLEKKTFIDSFVNIHSFYFFFIHYFFYLFLR